NPTELPPCRLEDAPAGWEWCACAAGTEASRRVLFLEKNLDGAFDGDVRLDYLSLAGYGRHWVGGGAGRGGRGGQPRPGAWRGGGGGKARRRRAGARSGDDLGSQRGDRVPGAVPVTRRG